MIQPVLNYKWLLTFLFLMGITGCGSTGKIKNDHREAVYAEQLFQRGELKEAAKAFLQLADEHSADRAYYRLRAAETLRESGNLEAASKVLSSIKSRQLSQEETVRMKLILAEGLLSRHRPEPDLAIDVLSFSEKNLPASLQIRTLELRARAYQAQAEHIASARTRLVLNSLLKGNDRLDNEAQILGVLAQNNAEELRSNLTELSENDPLRPWLERALRKKGETTLHPGKPVGTQLPGQQMRREGYKAVRQVALLLPAENSLKLIAQSIRDGFFMAQSLDPSESKPEIRVYEVGSSPEEVVNAYQQAAAEGADRVVGPVTRKGVSAIFSQKKLPVPTLALNHSESDKSPPSGNAEFGLLPETEAMQAADYMRDRGILRAVAITATDEWAERAALAFRTQFERGGGTVAGEARLKEGEINFSATIRQALAGMPAGRKGGNAKADKTFDENGLFISMRPQQARLLLPQLKIAGYSALPIFATSHIYSGTPNAALDRDMNGVYFCDAPWLFDATPGLPKRAEIVLTMASARGGNGARLFAFGMDAYALLPYLDWLEHHRDAYLPGATGQLLQDSSGRIRRQLIWAQFVDGVAHPVDELKITSSE